jgi:hypothetical protein
MSDQTLDATGGCYCGAVRYRASGVRDTVSECHCSLCRSQSGHRYATTGAKTSDIEIDGADNITWFEASSDARRGFCSKCGSHMFWQSASEDHSAILAASLDTPNDLKPGRHIFVADKGAYYTIDDDLPQFADYTTPVKPAPRQ